jgi:hypothetical protein
MSEMPGFVESQNASGVQASASEDDLGERCPLRSIDRVDNIKGLIH